jgi:hypothetical protein
MLSMDITSAYDSIRRPTFECLWSHTTQVEPPRRGEEKYADEKYSEEENSDPGETIDTSPNNGYDWCEEDQGDNYDYYDVPHLIEAGDDLADSDSDD